MKKIIWEPDTCSCVLEIHYEVETPRDRVYKQRTACPAHQGPNGAEMAKDDNLYKCAVIGVAGEDAGWHFTIDRKLVVDVDAKHESAVREEGAKYPGRELIIAIR